MNTITLNGVNYRVVKKESKLGQKIIHKYDNYEGVHLWDVYGHFSSAKINAFNYCKARQGELKGYGFVITSHNIFQFTCAFEFRLNDKNWLAYFTSDNNFVVCLSD